MDDESFHAELVPLVEAAATAYHILAERNDRPRLELDDLRTRIAIALSSLVPVLEKREGVVLPLTAVQLQSRILVPQRRAEFTGLYVRRGELIRAVESLKEARVDFRDGS